MHFLTSEKFFRSPAQLLQSGCWQQWYSTRQMNSTNGCNTFKQSELFVIVCTDVYKLRINFCDRLTVFQSTLGLHSVGNCYLMSLKKRSKCRIECIDSILFSVRFGEQIMKSLTFNKQINNLLITVSTRQWRLKFNVFLVFQSAEFYTRQLIPLS